MNHVSAFILRLIVAALFGSGSARDDLPTWDRERICGCPGCKLSVGLERQALIAERLP